jgi:hypothetical protein
MSDALLPALADPGPFSDAELFALAGFLAGYSGLTHEAYALDLRQYASYCAQHRLALFDARRAHIETFARHLETAGKARATIARRLCTVTCFYRYAEQEGLIDYSPAVHVRRPRLDYESHATGLDRNELGAMLVVAGLASPRDHALIALLALNGLRVSEALGADIENLGLERGHRTVTVLRKGAKTVLVPMAPRTPAPSTSRSGNAPAGRSSSAATASGSTATPPPASSGAPPKPPGSPNESDPTPSDTASSPPPSTPASHSATSKRQPVTPTREPPCATTEPECLSTATPPTSSPPSSPERPDNRSSQTSHNERRAGNLDGCPRKSTRPNE